MKYVVVLGDGMADEPLEELKGATPLEVAVTPTMDELAKVSELGLSANIPEGMKPGSDTANLAVLGYYPKKYYSGRSPLEALSIGVPMKDDDIAIRCNLVTLTEEEGIPYRERTIIDHSSSEITTEEADVLVKALIDAGVVKNPFSLYTGTSYRHCLIWSGGKVVQLAQPHDIPGRVIGEYLPEDSLLKDMMEKSYEVLNNHPINVERAKKGLHKANSMWFWGAGTKPALISFTEKTGKKGAMISAVDLLKGIAIGTGMHVEIVPGADGTLETNYEGKARAAVRLLKEGYDFSYVHVEAPDEMGHQGSIERKIKAIEYLDSRVIKVIKDEMDAWGEPYRMMILPDHPTPIWCRTHTSDPVPFMIYDSTRTEKGADAYNEKTAKAAGLFVPEGYKLIDRLFATDTK
ncbi:MAG: cofactor-independent phosphoglycerate mutase [Lachnospiraceae bacterium]|nr:cofactor-independent phosphoglycerate mutase [Lachnospiraceae bacterium]